MLLSPRVLHILRFGLLSFLCELSGFVALLLNLPCITSLSSMHRFPVNLMLYSRLLVFSMLKEVVHSAPRSFYDRLCYQTQQQFLSTPKTLTLYHRSIYSPIYSQNRLVTTESQPATASVDRTEDCCFHSYPNANRSTRMPPTR